MEDFVNIDEGAIHVWIDNHFVCSNYFKDSKTYEKKKNTFFETRIKVENGYVELGTRLVNDELDEELISTSYDWHKTFDAFKED